MGTLNSSTLVLKNYKKRKEKEQEYSMRYKTCFFSKCQQAWSDLTERMTNEPIIIFPKHSMWKPTKDIFRIHKYTLKKHIFISIYMCVTLN